MVVMVAPAVLLFALNWREGADLTTCLGRAMVGGVFLAMLVGLIGAAVMQVLALPLVVLGLVLQGVFRLAARLLRSKPEKPSGFQEYARREAAVLTALHKSS